MRDYRTGRKAARAGMVAAGLAGALAGTAAAVPSSVSRVVRGFARRLEDFGRIYAAHAGWARARGLPVLGAGAASLGWLRSRGRRSSARSHRAGSPSSPPTVSTAWRAIP